MRHILRDLDRLLRGEATRASALQRGTLDVRESGLAIAGAILGIVYGLCMGSYAVFRGNGPDGWWQMLASALKVPFLFLLTLVVTFPSLYVFNALFGSRLALRSVLRLLVAALAVMLAVLASLGPIVAFFSVSTTSYTFMQLLNVATFTVAGFLGLKFLLFTLHRLDVAQTALQREDDLKGGPLLLNAAQTAPSGPLDRTDGQVLGTRVVTIFRLWVVVFGLVGAQMGWVLRPFVGYPGAPFSWFRGRESNFFEAVLRAVGHLISGS